MTEPIAPPARPGAPTPHPPAPPTPPAVTAASMPPVPPAPQAPAPPVPQPQAPVAQPQAPVAQPQAPVAQPQVPVPPAPQPPVPQAPVAQPQVPVPPAPQPQPPVPQAPVAPSSAEATVAPSVAEPRPPRVTVAGEVHRFNPPSATLAVFGGLAALGVLVTIGALSNGAIGWSLIGLTMLGVVAWLFGWVQVERGTVSQIRLGQKTEISGADVVEIQLEKQELASLTFWSPVVVTHDDRRVALQTLRSTSHADTLATAELLATLLENPRVTVSAEAPSPAPAPAPAPASAQPAASAQASTSGPAAEQGASPVAEPEPTSDELFSPLPGLEHPNHR